MTEMSTQEQWIVLEKPLYLEGQVRLTDKIKKAKEMLKKLLALEQKGVKTVRARRRVSEIDGLAIKYAVNGRNKQIAYEASMTESEEDFTSRISRIFGALESKGYKPTLCRKRVKVEIGKGARCLI